MEFIYLGLGIIFVFMAGYFMYKKGIKKGMDDFLKILLTSGFDHKINAFNIQNTFIEKGGIVFVGDSITQDYNVYEYFHGLNVYNRGIGGDTTKGLLSRLHLSIFDLEPKIVVILIGTNDFALLKTTVEEVYMNIELIVKKIKIKLPKTKIILQSVYPVNETLSPMTVLPRKNEIIRKLNDLLSQIKDVEYVQLFDLLIDEHGQLNKKYTVEGLHINEQGYALITKTLDEYLK
ncbi:GDSL-type esterase/lipase family protein [Peloplasma aerotolerans]|uniref:GDSL-type esterase/lipase family protein n=1 Tax=Peloplasma aerotolerans TaxID=3044389 RepID=A0AAW6U5D4_9MOLU|nr:GDSL-type esterase/lipase family protein [Mariniplasma sp. M4Ah]MDI6453112.1 GDSL-type esterase/lipase family protein [Mariniplasma sp. M4Ah]